MIFTVHHILDKKNKTVITISPDATVQEAIEIMAKKTISALPVVVKGKVTGIISERDYIRKAAPNRLLGTDKLTFKSIIILFQIPIKSLLPLSRT